MERRSFLKTTASAGFITLITPYSVIHSFARKRSDSSYEGFANPSRSYRPYTWWHWMNGNVSREGITLDLEAMKAAGLGGFQMFEVGTGIPAGPIVYLSEQWLALVKHTIAECERLDLEFAMHNCPGWSASGGPWITPELAMQQFTYSETSIEKGGPVNIKLPSPPQKAGFYKDAAVIAFPSLAGEAASWVNQLHQFSINGQPANTNILSGNGTFIEPAISLNGNKTYLGFEFKNKYNARSVTVFYSGKGRMMLQSSDDGYHYNDICELTSGGINGDGANSFNPATACFPLVASKYYRIELTGDKAISSIQFSGEDRLPHYMAKANVRLARYDYKELVTTTAPSSAIDPQTVIDLSGLMDKDGNLKWNAPPGAWTIIRLGHTAIEKKNHAAPTYGTGLECDKLSREAFNYHWQHMFKNLLPLLQALKGEKAGLLIDSFEMGVQNWTAGFPEAFGKKNQYSILNYIPALTGRIVKSQEATERFLSDFRETQANMMADNYYGRFAELCKANNIISYTEPYEGGNFEEMQIGRRVDVVMGEFWGGLTMLWNNKEIQRTVKLAASIAHSKGQSVVGAEAFTAEPGSGKWQEHPYNMKALGDYMFTRGLTRIIFHRFAHQPHPTALPGMTMGPWGTHFDRTNTWFHASHEWLKYISRCQFALRQGVFVADLAYYVGEDVPGKTIVPEKTGFPPPAGYDYDFINKECILNECIVRNGKLVSSSGITYSVLILPEHKGYSYEILNKIQQFVAEGLIVIGSRPVQSTAFTGLDETSQKIVSQLWGQLFKPGAVPQQYGKGYVYWPERVEEVMAAVQLEKDFTYTSRNADSPINFIHRRIGEDDLYFIANRRRTPESIVASFRITGKQPEIWNPMTGKISAITIYEDHGSGTRIPLHIAPSGSVIIAFRRGNRTRNWTRVSAAAKPLIDTRPFAIQQKGLYPHVFSNFTIECWAKPETDIALIKSGMFGKLKTDCYVIFPAAGSSLYGSKHGCCGLTIGRNGIGIYEREGDEINVSLLVEVPVSGWSHVAVVYRNNTPSVFLNGKLINTGEPSTLTLHPSVGESYQQDGASYYNGEMTQAHVISEAITEAAVAEIFRAGLPSLPAYPDVETYPDNASQLLIWKNGTYQLTGPNGRTSEFEVNDIPDNVFVHGPWQVNFPADTGAPEQIVLEKLVSLHKHMLDGVKFFSGTSIYSAAFQLPDQKLLQGKTVFLDLGRVEVMAEVIINDTKLPVIWAPPFRTDITSAIRPGTNSLKVNVTNLWPNRLIGDEWLPEENKYTPGDNPRGREAVSVGAILQLPDWYVQGRPKPAGGRITFSTWRHYNKHSPLLESGLLGPVKLVFGELKPLV